MEVGGNVCLHSLAFKSYCGFEHVTLRGKPVLIHLVVLLYNLALYSWELVLVVLWKLNCFLLFFSLLTVFSTSSLMLVS